MEKSNILEREKINVLLFKLSTPAIISMLASALYSVCDRLFVGIGVGTLGISGVSISYPLTLLVNAFGMLVGSGATSLVSLKLGEKNYEECEKIIGNAFTLAILASIIFTGFCLLYLKPLLILFGANAEILPYAIDYSQILILGTVFQICSFSMNNILRGQGKAKKAMYNFFVSIILNVLLNPIFIFIFHMGIRGSALATVLSTIIGCGAILFPYISQNSKLRLKLKNLKLQSSIVFSNLSIGVSGFIMQLTMGLITILYNIQCAHYGGSDAIAIFGVLNSLVMLIYMPIYGINQGAQPVIGYNYGAKKYDRVLEALKLSTIACTFIAILGFVGLETFSKNIFTLFNHSDPKFIAMGSHALRLYGITLPLIGFIILGSSYFQYIGKAKYSISLTLFRQVILLIPAVLLLPHFLNIEGLWLSTLIPDISSSILLALVLVKEIKNLRIPYEGHEETEGIF